MRPRCEERARAAATHGGAVSGLVLTAIDLPRVLLLIVGGTVGDRSGARWVMIAGDAVMSAGTLLPAAVSHQVGPAVRLLPVTGALVGVMDAFHLPASGSTPLRLVGKEALPRALAMRRGGAQLVTFVAGPPGGAPVATVGLTGTALLNAATFAVVLIVLPRRPPGLRHTVGQEAAAASCATPWTGSAPA